MTSPRSERKDSCLSSVARTAPPRFESATVPLRGMGDIPPQRAVSVMGKNESGDDAHESEGLNSAPAAASITTSTETKIPLFINPGDVGDCGDNVRDTIGLIGFC